MHIFARLEEAPEPALESVAAAGAPGTGSSAAADIAELDAFAGQLWGEVPSDPIAADRAAGDEAAAAATSKHAGSSSPSLFTAGAWSEQRVQGYMRMLVNPKLLADGKEPLSQDEIEEGGRIGARIFADLFGARAIENPWLALLAWGGVVIGSRYFGEIFLVITNVMRRRRGQAVVTSSSEPAAAAETRAGAADIAVGWKFAA